MLRLRRAELQTQIEADRARLRRVEARLHSIESEEDMHTDDIIMKLIETQRYAELSALAAGFQRLDQWVAANGYRPAGPAREIYLDCPEDMTAWVTELQVPIEPAT